MPYDDNDFDPDDLSDDEKEEFEKKQKEEQYLLRKHPLLCQAKEIMKIVDVLMDTRAEESKNVYGNTLHESAMIIVAKLSSAIPSESYLVRMQNAALVREHAEYLRLSNHMLKHIGGFDEKHIRMFREEMEKFRGLFREWAKEIHAMENDFEDEWGLFVN
jgi:hypothetical protein